MASPERPLSESDRAPETGREGSGLEKQALGSRVTARRGDSDARTYFELIELGTTGLEAVLEEIGIVPPLLDNPNPFHAEQELGQHMQWWEQHPEEHESYRRAFDERAEILDTLYLGACLRRVTGGRLYRFRDVPSPLTRQAVTEFLRQEYEMPVVLIEDRLRPQGLLAALEEAEIVPTSGNPPNEWLDWNREQRERWKKEHSEYDERVKILRYLHIGAMLDRLLDEGRHNASAFSQ